MTSISLTAIAIAFATAAFVTPVVASTAMEKKILTYPMPHTLLPAGGTRVKVHYTRTHSNPQGNKPVEALAKLLKEQISWCVSLRNKARLPANPPSAIPDYALGFYTDTYRARNREISYERRHSFKMNEDCSIAEDERLEAILTSDKGMCKIDFATKTAVGVCDRTGHANAVAYPPVPRMTSAETKAMMAQMGSDPKTSAYMKQIASLMGNATGVAGPKKTILGIECEVVSASLGPVQSTQCIAYPPASSAAGDGGNSGIVLDMVGQDMGSAKAVEAKLDADVSSALFVPYATGFKISAE